MGLPAHRLDNEEPGARQGRMQIIATAIADVSLRATCSEQYADEDCKTIWPRSPAELSALLVEQAYSESRLAKNVHEGQCHAWECDPVKSTHTGKLRHRARSLWQIHRSGPVESEWEQMLGADLAATTAGAWAASKLLSRGYRACGTVTGAISRYAGLDSCRWSEADKRARLYAALRERVVKLERRADPKAQGSKREATLASRR